MSNGQKETLVMIYRSVIGVLLSIATFIGVSVYNKVDKTYDFVIKHEEQINQLKEQNNQLRSELNSIRYGSRNYR